MAASSIAAGARGAVEWTHRTRSEELEQRLRVPERTPLRAHRQCERARDLGDNKLRRVPDRLSFRHMVEQLCRLTVGRQGTYDSRCVENRLSERHDRGG